MGPKNSGSKLAYRRIHYAISYRRELYDSFREITKLNAGGKPSTTAFVGYTCKTLFFISRCVFCMEILYSQGPARSRHTRLEHVAGLPECPLGASECIWDILGRNILDFKNHHFRAKYFSSCRGLPCGSPRDWAYHFQKLDAL